MVRRKLSEVLQIGANGKLCLRADARLTAKPGPNPDPEYKGSVEPGDPDAPIDFRFDAKGKKWGLGTAFLRDE